MSNFENRAGQIANELRGDLFQELQNDQEGFIKISEILKDLAGINLPLNEKNLSLVASRLSGVIKACGATSYNEYINALNSLGFEAIQEFISQLTTNTTHFFRENVHFSFLSEILPKIAAKKKADRKSSINIWCAASSTGQEAYSLAMTVLEAIPTRPILDIQILGSDIDLSVLGKAEEGVYSENEMQGVSEILKSKYFDYDHKTNQYQVKTFLKEIVKFAEFNLTAESYPFRDHFDIVFCRNVLIYFERDLCHKVVNKLTNSIQPSGYLFLGHSESGAARSERLKSVSNSVYLRVK